MAEQIAIVGAGTMGTGIAVNAAMNGISVRLLDSDPSACDRATARLARMLERHQTKGRLSAADCAASLQRISVTSELDAAGSAPLVIEAVYEDFAVKRAVLERLDQLCAPEAVIATNTSALQISALAGCLRNPERFLGMHYFSPADSSPVVELVRGDQTGADALARARQFLRLTKRDILLCKDSPGFAINRFFVPFLNAAAQAVDAGLGTVGQINALGRALTGAPIGPFEAMNFIKPEIVLHAQRHLEPLGEDYRPARGLTRLVAQGEDWQIDAPSAPPAEADRARRTLLQGILEPANALRAEGVASPEDIDRCARSALKWTKGPFEADWALGSDLASEVSP